MYRDYEIVFDSADSWSFSNHFVGNIIIFADNSLSSHANNLENDFLVLGEGSTDDINDSIGATEKTFNINFKGATKL